MIEFKRNSAGNRQQITATLEERERPEVGQDAEMSPLAAAYLEGFPLLLNRELAERLADIAASYYHHRAARVHSEP